MYGVERVKEDFCLFKLLWIKLWQEIHVILE